MLLLPLLLLSCLMPRLLPSLWLLLPAPPPVTALVSLPACLPLPQAAWSAKQSACCLLFHLCRSRRRAWRWPWPLHLHVDHLNIMTLNVPPACCSQVTEAGMAVAMASVGGMGFIHYNNSLEEQLHQARSCRRSELPIRAAPAACRAPAGAL